MPTKIGTSNSSSADMARTSPSLVSCMIERKANEKLGIEMPIKPGKYIHLKGNEYEVLGTVTHSETPEEMVVYRALYGEWGVWARPGRACGMKPWSIMGDRSGGSRMRMNAPVN